MTRMTELMAVKHSPFLLILVLLSIFQFTVWFRGWIGQAWVNPTLITTAGVIFYLFLTDTPYESFDEASKYLTFWLQPVVVCLAVPLYTQWQKIKAQWFAIMMSQLVGSVVGIITGVGLVLLLGGSQTVAVAVAAKSVTMPIAIEVTKSLNGVVGLNAATVLIAGVVGQVVGIFVLLMARIRRPMSQGLAMGTASHALGTVRVMQMSHRYVAYATVGLIMNGILTAFFAPVIVPILLNVMAG